jgi:hypothetical protein
LALLAVLIARAGPAGPQPPAQTPPAEQAVLLEPPPGRVVHGMGQWEEDNQAYLQMLGGESLYPLTRLFFFDLEPVRPWPLVLEGLRTYLEEERAAGRIPNINLGLSGPAKESVAWWTTPPPAPFGIDDVLANSNAYDSRLDDIIRAFLDHQGPIFLRIGGEFNGPWNGHHPYDYPQAFRKIVTLFKARGLHRVAFIWCYEPSAPDDFDQENETGAAKWFPGDEVIDWYAIDVFARKDFSDSYPETERGQRTPKGKTERFLRMAQDHGRPVMIAESSVVDYDITSPGVWDEWFSPYFAFIQAHPHIKAFVYVNAEWPRYRKNDPFHWMDGRINLNPEVSDKYRQELEKGKYLHVGEGHLLNGFQKKGAGAR